MIVFYSLLMILLLMCNVSFPSLRLNPWPVCRTRERKKKKSYSGNAHKLLIFVSCKTKRGLMGCKTELQHFWTHVGAVTNTLALVETHTGEGVLCVHTALWRTPDLTIFIWILKYSSIHNIPTEETRFFLLGRVKFRSMSCHLGQKTTRAPFSFFIFIITSFY